MRDVREILNWDEVHQKVEELRQKVTTIKTMEGLTAIEPELMFYVQLSRVARLFQDFDLVQAEFIERKERLREVDRQAKERIKNREQEEAIEAAKEEELNGNS